MGTTSTAFDGEFERVSAAHRTTEGEPHYVVPESMPMGGTKGNLSADGAEFPSLAEAIASMRGHRAMHSILRASDHVCVWTR